MDGSVKWEKTATVDSLEDSVRAPIKMEYPAGLTPVHFIRLKLTRGADAISENFYLRGAEEDDLPRHPRPAQSESGSRHARRPARPSLDAHDRTA